MLVKFLSYIVTMIGTKRYKPLVFSGLAIAISLVGVTAVWSAYEPSHGTAASTLQKAEDPTKETLSEQTLSKRSTREDVPTQQEVAEPPATNTTPNTNTSNTVNGTAAAPTIQATSDTAFTLKKGAPVQQITFSLSDASAMQWAVTPDNSNGPSATSSQDNSASTSYTLNFKAGQATAGTYTFTVHAKDASRTLDLTKTITVTVVAE